MFEAMKKRWLFASALPLSAFAASGCDEEPPETAMPCVGCEAAGGAATGGATSVGGSGASMHGFEGPAPEFSLVDVNATSPSHGDPVSPRDYLEQVSAWYFAHAT